MIDPTKISVQERHDDDGYLILTAGIKCQCDAFMHPWQEECFREEIERRLKTEIWHAVYGDLIAPLRDIRRDICYTTETYRGNDALLKKVDALLAMIEAPNFPALTDA